MGTPELILADDKRTIVAVLLPEQIHIGHIEYFYAMGQGVWSEGVQLAARWNCWAVLCDPAWGERQIKLKAPRPAGAKIVFV